MTRRRSRKAARSFPISSRISLYHSSLANFSHLNIPFRLNSPYPFLPRSCLEELHFLDIFTAPEENYLTAYRQSLFRTAVKMSQGLPVGNPSNPGISEGDGWSPYNPCVETTAVVRPRGSSEEPPSQRPAEKKRALNPPEPNVRGSVSTNHEMIWDMHMNALLGTPDPNALVVSHNIYSPSTPQPDVAAQSYSNNSDSVFCQLINIGRGPQISVNSGMSWHSPMPTLLPSPTAFSPYTLTPFGAPHAGTGLHDPSSSNVSTPSKPGPRHGRAMPPLTNHPRGDMRPLVANFPSLLLQGLSQSHAGTIADSTLEPASIIPSLFTSESSRMISQGNTAPIVEDVSEFSNADSDPPADLEAPNEAAPISTQTPTQAHYLEWEDAAIINHWTGPGSSIERVQTSLAAGMTPRDEDRLDKEWKTLATRPPLNGRRTPLALARHWTLLVRAYFNIRIAGSLTEPNADNSGEAIAARVLAQAQSVQPTDKVIRNMKASNVIQWFSGENGWFKTMHTQLRYFKAPAPGGKDTWPPIPYSMATQPHSMSPVFGASSVSHPIFAPTPPPPSSTSQGHSAMGSGHGVAQPTQVPHGAPVPHPPGSQQAAPVGMASTWEMARDNHAVAESQIGVLASKEDYLNGHTVLSYIAGMKQLMEMQHQNVEFRSVWLLKLIHLGIPELRHEAIALLRQLHLVDPVMIDYGLLLSNLEMDMKRRGMLPVEEE